MIRIIYARFLPLAILLASCSEGEKPVAEVKSNRPNIVYILADDLGYGDISAYNEHSKIRTPHLDRLAAEGMMLTDAHSPSSVCTPTRYGILTGRYCWRSRLPRGVLRGFGRALLEPDRRTVADLLKAQAYTTGVVGKWHLGLDWVLKEGRDTALTSSTSVLNEVGMVRDMDQEHIDLTRKPTDGPLDHGFDYSFILPASLDMPPYCYLENDQLVTAPTQYTPGNDLNTGYTEAFWRAGGIAPGFDMDQVLPTFGEKAIAFIDRSVASQKPFFLYLPLAAPHTPWVPTAAYEDTSAAGTYGDFVTMVDATVGQVLQALLSAGVEDETLVIFTSDNGPFWTPSLVEQFDHRSAGAWRGMKADAWEGGHRVPFIARWPGQIEPGSNSGALTCLTNLFATVADIIGVPIREHEAQDSYSIWPILTGASDVGQSAVVHHSSRAFFAIRQGAWKYIEGRGSGGFSEPRIIEPGPGEPVGQLYHLQRDPGEAQNLYESHPEKVQELLDLLDQIRAAD